MKIEKLRNTNMSKKLKVKLKKSVEKKRMKQPSEKEMWAKIFDFYGADTVIKQGKIIEAVTAAAEKYNVTIIKYLEKFFEKQEKDTPTPATKKEVAKVAVIKEPPPEDPLPWDFKSDSMTHGYTIMLPKGYKSPIVEYTPHAKAIIDYLVANNSQEVGWLGTVEREGHRFIIDQIYVPSQEVSSVETLIDHNAMTDLWEEIFSSGGDPGKLIYWGHSHVNMGVSPSGQDEYQVRRFLRGCPIFIRGIYNKAGASKVDVYDMDNRIVTQCVPNSVAAFKLPDEDEKHLAALVKQNVRARTYAYPKAPVGGTPAAKKPISTGGGINYGWPNYDYLDDPLYESMLSDPFYAGKP